MLFAFDCKEGLRSRLILSLSCFGLVGLLLGGYAIGSSYFSVSGYGDWGLPSQELVVWLCLLSMVIMAISVGGLFFSKIRCTSMAVFLGSGLLVVMSIASLKSADGIRLRGFERLSKEAAPLVSAIHAYQQKFGHPPESLDVLQTTYPQEHVIEGRELPGFEYFPGELAMERYHGNPWVLKLETPTGPLRWDRFIYYPLQNYPSLGHGGWLEKVGDWAYVHE